MKNNFYEIIELSLSDYPLDVTGVRKIIFYNSIESTGTVVEMYYNDISSLVDTLPIMGGETLKINIVDQYQNEIDLEFVLTDFSHIYQKDGLHSVVKFKAIEKKSLLLSTERINKYWEQTTISTIIEEIDDTIEIEQTSNKQIVDILIPGWSKTKTISYLSNIAFSDTYGSYYLFFQTIEGKMLFIPINKMFDINEVNAYQLNNRNPYYRYNIHEMDVTRNVDVISNMYDNVFEKEYVTYIPDMKTTITKNINLTDTMNDVIDLESGSIIGNDLEQLSQNIKTHEAIPFYDPLSIEPQTKNQIQYNIFQKEIEVLLNGDFGVKVGDVLFLDLKDIRQHTEQNKIRAGCWAIKNIAYHISDGDFKIKARLVRESIYESEKDYPGKILNVSISN